MFVYSNIFNYLFLVSDQKKTLRLLKPLGLNSKSKKKKTIIRVLIIIIIINFGEARLSFWLLLLLIGAH